MVGKLLVELGNHQCCFPLAGEGAQTRFCAAEVPTGDWLRGFPGGSYCDFHRGVSRGHGTEAERSAHRVLVREAST